jgi:hypothetical protein
MKGAMMLLILLGAAVAALAPYAKSGLSMAKSGEPRHSPRR